MQLMALRNVIQQTKMTKESFVKVHQEFFKLNCQLNANANANATNSTRTQNYYRLYYFTKGNNNTD